MALPVMFPDQVEGQDMQVILNGYPNNVSSGVNGVVLGGVQAVRGGVRAPKAIRNDILGVKRYQRTGPVTVEWSCSSFTLYRQTLADVFNLTTNASFDYGNYNWNRLVFDLVEKYAAADQNGITFITGGWTISKAVVVNYDLDLTDPNTIVMQNMTGLAFAMFYNPWSGPGL